MLLTAEALRAQQRDSQTGGRGEWITDGCKYYRHVSDCYALEIVFLFFVNCM